MKILAKSLTLSAVLAVSLFLGTAHAADKTYQATGPVLEVSDTTIVIQKGKEKWEIARTKDTKVTGDLKVGSKVTVQYTMTAVSAEAKGDAKGGAKADDKADAKPDKGAKK